MRGIFVLFEQQWYANKIHFRANVLNEQYIITIRQIFAKRVFKCENYHTKIILFLSQGEATAFSVLLKNVMLY